MMTYKDPCSLRAGDAAIGIASQCWRGECLICGWAKDCLEKRKHDIRRNGLYTATDAEVDAFIEAHEYVLSRKAVEYLHRHGLRYYKVYRGV